MILADPFPVPNLKSNLGTASFYQRWLSLMFLNNFVAHSNNLKLAQRMYQARVLELKQLILAEEARFKFVFILGRHICRLYSCHQFRCRRNRGHPCRKMGRSNCE